jgi:arsenical pump membrane protein
VRRRAQLHVRQRRHRDLSRSLQLNVGVAAALAALVAVAIAAAAGTVGVDDLVHAGSAQWRAFVTLAAVMTMTSAAERMGLLDRLAAAIEPRTRGPVRHAFRVTFAISAVVAAVLSNDAAILLLTPTVLTLLRTVYPRRNPKFLVPFAFAVFAAAGVAPLVISNPMNLIFADHRGIGFNRYALTMIPVALVGWVVTYATLAWCFREPLSDDAPALGAWPTPPAILTTGAKVVLATLALGLGAYPVMSYLGAPLWPIAAAGGLACALASLASGHGGSALARGITWSIFPFLAGVYVLALGLEHAGVVDRLASFYAGSEAPVLTVGVTSALGSALLNNHPMSVLNAFALDRVPGSGDAHAFAALVGGDLGPRLLPLGSLASLLWFDILRRHQVEVKVTTFIRIGLILTVPTLAVSLAVLWVLSP